MEKVRDFLVFSGEVLADTVDDAELDDIIDRLLEAMSPDCQPNLQATDAAEDQIRRLRRGIAKMRAAGVEFDDADVELIADGDLDEADERFGPVPGYADVAAALVEIFEEVGR